MQNDGRCASEECWSVGFVIPDENVPKMIGIRSSVYRPNKFYELQSTRSTIHPVCGVHCPENKLSHALLYLSAISVVALHIVGDERINDKT